MVFKKVKKMSTENKTFLELCIEGKESPSNIDDYVDEWHNGTDPREIYEFLGMTWDEYGLWVENSKAIFDIIEKRKNPKE